MKTVLLGSGCFWSKEFYLSRVPGVVATHVGFAGGTTENPSYRDVCGKQTGHAEVVKVDYDPSVLSLHDLLIYFFSLHDSGRDRRDRGGQYRSAIFFSDACHEDFRLAEQMIAHLVAKTGKNFTQIAKNIPFYPAEGRHQQYCETRSIDPKYPTGTETSIRADFGVIKEES